MSNSLYGFTHDEQGKRHLYLFPGQTLSDGSTVDPSFRIQCDRTLRDSKPEFSVWSINRDAISLHPDGKHYTAKTSEANMSHMAIFNTAIDVLRASRDDKKNIYLVHTKEKLTSSEKHIPGNFWIYYLGKFAYVSEGQRPINVTSKTAVYEGKSMSHIIDHINKKADSTIIDMDKVETKSGPEPEPVKVSWIDEVMKDSSISCPTPKKDGFYISSANWKLLIRNIKRQVNTLIVGPTGTGKTSCIKYAAEKLGMKLTIIDMGATIDPISSLLGVHRLKDGRSVFDYAQFTQAIQEPGIILLDEVNRAPMGSGNVLFPCLDDRRVLPIEIANGDGPREIKIHPEVTFIATANLGSEYTGTTGIMDRAFVNRFFPLELTYLPERIEKEVLKMRTGIEDKDSDLIVKVANTIRNMNNKMELSMGVSVRETLMISNLVADGWALGEAMKTVYLPMFEGTDSEGERSKLFKVLASY